MAKKPVVQGGVENYLGKQPQVVAPRKWQSSPDAPPTELAYITKAEKDLILKKDIHGSLDKGPNMGPSGIMSLDSFGDIGGAGASGGDTEASGGAKEGAGFSGRGPGETQSDFDMRTMNQREILQKAEQRQAERLSELTGRNIRERRNIANFKSRRGPFGLGNLLSTALGFINPALGLITRGLPNLFNKLRGKTVTQDDDDTTLLDQINQRNLPFARTYLQGLQKNLSPIGTNFPGANTLDVGLTEVPADTGLIRSQPDVNLLAQPAFNLNRTIRPDPFDYTTNFDPNTGQFTDDRFGITRTQQFDDSPYGRIRDDDMVP